MFVIFLVWLYLHSGNIVAVRSQCCPVTAGCLVVSWGVNSGRLRSGPRPWLCLCVRWQLMQLFSLQCECYLSQNSWIPAEILQADRKSTDGPSRQVVYIFSTCLSTQQSSLPLTLCSESGKIQVEMGINIFSQVAKGPISVPLCVQWLKCLNIFKGLWEWIHLWSWNSCSLTQRSPIKCEIWDLSAGKLQGML